MDFWQVLKNRHCVRNFDSNRPVPDQQIEQLISAAKMAPSAGNLQDWDFKVINQQETKDSLAAATRGQEFLAQAPVVIVVCADTGKNEKHYGHRGKELYSIQDTAAATQNLLLAATALGLGACWVGAFNEGEVRQILDLGKNLRPVVIIPIGYPQ